MAVTDQLLRLYRADMKIRGLRSRLDAAERFLGAQVTYISEATRKHEALEAQIRQAKAVVANEEGEVARIDARMEERRELMNSANTNREYKALLSEVNTLKDDKSAHEDNVLKLIERIDALEAQLGEVTTDIGERERVKGVAETDRNSRASEIKDQLKELEAERVTLAAEVPADAMRIYSELLEARGEDAMAPLEIEDRKRHEYVCGSSMMSVPMETAMSLLDGKLTLSPNDGCILYMTEEVTEALTTKGKK